MNATISLLAKTGRRELPSTTRFLELLHPRGFSPSKNGEQLTRQMAGMRFGIEDVETKRLLGKAAMRARSYGPSLERMLNLVEKVKGEGSPRRLRDAASFLHEYYSRFPKLEHHEFSAYKFPRD